jgi:hypothetical protein
MTTSFIIFFVSTCCVSTIWKHGTKFRRKRKRSQPHMSSTRASWAIRLLLFSMDFHSLTQSNDLQCITYSLSPPSNYTILGWAGLDSLLVATHTHTHTHIQYIQSINFYIIIYVDLPVRITARFVTYKLTVHTIISIHFLGRAAMMAQMDVDLFIDPRMFCCCFY